VTTLPNARALTVPNARALTVPNARALTVRPTGRAAGAAGRPTRTRIRLAALAIVVVATASGCVSLQASGPISSVTEEGDGSSQVQIWPSPPSANEGASAIVAGFLEAAQSGSANLAIADDYLTAGMQKQWATEQDTVIVLGDDTQTYPQPPGQSSTDSGDAQSSGETADEGPNGFLDGVGQESDTSSGSDTAQTTEQVQGALLGLVDSSGLYSASSGIATYQFGVTQTKAGFRISTLPQGFGVLMERSDFESDYDRHDVYYENAEYPDKLIPAQVYLPAIDTDQEIAEAMTKLVVDGAPTQLGSAVQSAVPGAAFKSVQFGSDGDATVTINSKGACVKNASACTYLAEQLAETLDSLSTKVTAVTVVDQSNGQSYPLSVADGSLISYGLQQGARLNQDFYAVTTAGGVEQVSYFGTVGATNVPYGSVKTKFSAIAVGPPEEGSKVQPIALVSQDGTKVYVPRKQDDGYDLTQVYPAAGSTAPAGTVGELSWDDYGNLWFTVTLSGATSVYRYGQGELSQVNVTGLANDDQVTQVAAAPDGVRVAVGYKDPGGNAWVDIAGAVSDSDGNWGLQVGGSEVVAADWEQVNQFDWYNEDSLAVLGTEPNSQSLGLYQIYADGSSVFDSLTEQPVDASPPANADHFVWNSDGDPIASALNGSKEQLYELSVEGQDAQVLPDVFGTSPSY
jgi:hypothetical protein